MKVINHRLMDHNMKDVTFRQTPNGGSVIKPQFLVMHYTANRDMNSTIKWLCDKQSNASAHLVIDRDGKMVQLMPFDRSTWHAGRSSYKGLTNLNRLSIGIELVNAGRLSRIGSRWHDWTNRPVPDDEVDISTHKNEKQPAGWHTFPTEQLDAAFDACLAISRQYGIELIGHEDIAPGRKVDPGPAFPMAAFQARLQGRQDPPEAHWTTTAIVNIRSGPAVNFHTVAPALPRGAKVVVLDARGDWSYVDVEEPLELDNIQGWVASRFLIKL